MQMFMAQYDPYKAAEKRAIRDLSIFVVRLHTKAFILCLDPLGASKQDLEFLKAVQNYNVIDAAISSGVLKKMGTHLWYLHPETVALAFFDENVSVQEKQEMVNKLNQYTLDDIDDGSSPYRIKILPRQMQNLQH